MNNFFPEHTFLPLVRSPCSFKICSKSRNDWRGSKPADLVALVRAQALGGKTSDTGLKRVAWTAIVKDFNENYATTYTKQQIQNSFGRMKTNGRK